MYMILSIAVCVFAVLRSKPEVEGERVQVNIQLEGRSFQEQILGRIRLQSPTEDTQVPQQVETEAACEELKKYLLGEELDTAEEGPGYCLLFVVSTYLNVVSMICCVYCGNSYTCLISSQHFCQKVQCCNSLFCLCPAH